MKKNPLVDSNAFIGRWPFRKLSSNTPEKLLEIMNKKGLNRMWISCFEGIFWNNTRQANELLYEMTGNIPQFVPFAAINPHLSGCEKDIEECKFKWNMKGIRVYPNYHGYSVDSKKFELLLKKAGKLSLPVGIYCRLFDERLHPSFSRVEAVDLSSFKNKKRIFSYTSIIIYNCSLADLLSIKQILKKFRNIYVEISHLEGTGVIKKLIDEIGIEQILFGTYAPYFYGESSFLKIKESELSEREKRMIFSENAARLI